MRKDTVAPLAGAWIETHGSAQSVPVSQGSRPLRARGLKQNFVPGSPYTVQVAPLAGAWIETQNTVLDSSGMSVAPLAGAWWTQS